MENIKKIENPWSLEGEEILKSLQSSGNGLSDEEVINRTDLYGKNIFHRHERKSALSIFIKQIVNPLIFILIGAAIITAILKEWTEVIVISIAILVNTGLGFFREYHAENTLEKLSSFIKDRSRVVRGGREQDIDGEMLVPGDIIKISYGNRVPADARILFNNNLSIDEAILTGESNPTKKSSDSTQIVSEVSERGSMVHAGTLVVEGVATAVVVYTGDQTEIGRIAGLVSSTDRAKTPIQKGLSNLAWIIFAVVILLVIGIFILGILRGQTIPSMLVLAVAVAVGAVPEALPIALTVILSIGAERIAKKRGVARTLIAAETLGSTSLIMTDKTGTLTEANMKLVGIYTKEDFENENIEAKDYHKKDAHILEMAVSNIDILVENPQEDYSMWVFKGKPFEINIAKTAASNGLDILKIKKDAPSSMVIPFNSTHKFSVSLFESSYIVMGAPDVLLARSDVNAETYKTIESWIIKASNNGRRLIAIGKCKTDVKDISDVKNIEFLSILAFHDPVRKEVPDAINKINALGTRIVMVTGDLKGTAMAVAREIGWEVSDQEVLTGHDLHAMTDEALIDLLPKIKIFARVAPEDKLRVGLLYKKLGEVVAMTGDGVNDAPSLKAMDIGIALGSGSDVAKSAADLILLDDNFEIISSAIHEGRRILVNIRKTFVYLMSNSLDAVFVIGGSLIVGIALPLTALQIIWVNLFTGSLPALAFAYDEDFDHENSKKHTLKSIFTKEVNMLTFGIGIISSLLLFFMYFTLIKLGVEISLAKSVFFVCFASYVLAISFSFRSLHKSILNYPIFSNKKLNLSLIVATVFLVATMTIIPLREMFDLAPIPPIWLFFVLAWLVLNILLVETAKYLFRFGKMKSA